MASLLVSVSLSMQDALAARRGHEFDSAEVADLREGALALALGIIAECLRTAFAERGLTVQVGRVFTGGVIRLHVRLPNGEYIRPGQDGPEFGELRDFETKASANASLARAHELFEERVAVLAGKPLEGNPEEVPWLE